MEVECYVYKLFVLKKSVHSELNENGCLSKTFFGCHETELTCFESAVCGSIKKTNWAFFIKILFYHKSKLL